MDVENRCWIDVRMHLDMHSLDSHKHVWYPTSHACLPITISIACAHAVDALQHQELMCARRVENNSRHNILLEPLGVFQSPIKIYFILLEVIEHIQKQKWPSAHCSTDIILSNLELHLGGRKK